MANGAAGGFPPTPPPRTRNSPGGGSIRGALPNPRTQPLPPSSSQPLSAAEEKARLRAMYEAQDSPQPHSTPSPPPPSQYGYVPQSSPYSTPGMYSPPSPSPHGMQPMMSNGMNGANIHRQGSVTMPNIPPPPPLLPRPPREYIDETKEEDARTAARIQAMDNGFDVNGSRPSLPTKVSTYD